MNEDTIINENYNENIDELTRPNPEADREDNYKSRLMAKIAAASAVGVVVGAGGALAANALINNTNDNGDSIILPEVDEQIDAVVTAEEVAPAPQPAPKPEVHAPEVIDDVPDLLGAQIIEMGIDENGQHYAIVCKDGVYYGLLDTDGDGTYDIALYDANGDGNVSEAEVFDISKQHLAYETPEETPDDTLILDLSTAADTYVGYSDDGTHVMFVDQNGDGIYDFAIVDVDNTNTFDPFYSIDISDSGLRLGSILAEFHPEAPILAEPVIPEPYYIEDPIVAENDVKDEPADEFDEIPEPYSEDIAQVDFDDTDITAIDDTDLAGL